MFKKSKTRMGLYSPLILFFFYFLNPAFSQTSITNLNPSNYQTAFLNAGDKYYIDRNNTLISIPSALAGLLWIKTANDDKQTTGLNFHFDLTASATVYIAFDPRLGVPGWLSSGFNKTSHTIPVSDSQMGHFEVWSASYSTGTVTLGDNEANTSISSMYVVLVDDGGVPPPPPPNEPDINVSPSSWNFGSVNVNSSEDKTFVVSNTGNATLSVSSTSIVGTNASQFLIVSGGGSFSLSANSSRTIVVRFAPTLQSSKNATLRFISNDPNENPKDVSLSGSGGTQPTGSLVENLNPGNYQLANLNVGDEYYIDRNHTLVSIPSTFDGFLWIKTANDDKEKTGLDFRFDLTASATVYVAFDPRLNVPSWLNSGFNKTSHTIQVSDAMMGNFEVWSASYPAGRVNLGDNEASSVFSSMYVVLVDDGGVPPPPPPNEPDINVSPSSWNFGSVNVNSSEDKTFVVSNTGNATLSVSSTSIVGTNASQFLIVSGGGSFSLSANSSRTIVVRFAPTLQSSKNATLRFISNDPNENPKDVSLSGSGGTQPTGSLVENLNPSNYQLAFLNEGDEYYVDRNFMLVSIPSALEELLWIKTANDDKEKTGLDFRFDLTASATVYVAFDPRLNVPSWLNSGFNKTSHTIQVSDAMMGNFEVWSASYSTGRVTLGDNGQNQANPLFVSHYVVLIDGGVPPPPPPDEPDINVSPSSWNFGSVTVGNSSCKTFIVTNTGTATLSVSNTSIVGTHASQFSESVGAFSLSPGSSSNISVCFAPTSTGSKSATLRFISNDPDENPKDVPLSGIGGGQPPPPGSLVKNLNPGNYQLAFLNEGDEYYIDRNLTLTSIPSALEGFLWIKTANDDKQKTGLNFRFDLTAAATVYIAFDPRLNVPSWLNSGFNKTSHTIQVSDTQMGQFEVWSAPYAAGSVSLGDNEASSVFSSMYVVLLDDGTTPPPVADIDVSPSSSDFGSVTLGGSSCKTITVRNNGGATLNVSKTSIVGTHASQFSESVGAFSLSPGSSRSVNVCFAPTSTGSKNAALRFESNDPDENSKDVSLTGNGTQIPEADIDVSTSSLDFGNVNVHGSSCLIFEVKNTGNTTLSVSSTSIVGTHTSQFVIQNGGGSFSLLAGAAPRNITICFLPTSTGPKNAMIQFISNDPDESPKNVVLAGQGETGVLLTPPLDFGNVIVGDSLDKILILTNIGDGAVSVSNISISGTHGNQFSIEEGDVSFSISRGSSRNLVMRFAPAFPEGIKIALLSIFHNGAGSPFTVSLTGVGVKEDIPPQILRIETVVLAAWNTPTSILATVRDDHSVENVSLYYREGGGTTFQPTTMEPSGTDVYTGTVPPSAADSRGIEFYVEARDDSDNATESSHRFIPVQLPDKHLSKNHIGGSAQTGYRLISFPLQLDDTSVSATLLDILGPADSLEWRLWDIDPNKRDSQFPYREFPDVGNLSPGKAMFLITKETKTLTSGTGKTVSSTTPFPIQLETGWNMIASPYDFSVPIDNIEPATLRGQIYAYEGGWTSRPDFLRPWEGYLIKETTERRTLTINASRNITGAQPAVAKSANAPDWFIQIKAGAELALDNDNIAGVIQDAELEWDRYERFEPPPIGEFVMLSFPQQDWQRYPDVYATDFRQPSTEGHVWEFTVNTNITGKPVILNFENLKSVPDDFEIHLVDIRLNITQDLRFDNQYIYRSNSNSGKKRFQLIVGRSSFVEENNDQFATIPTEFVLSQNFPNPFNPATSIKFGLPQRSRVSLQIYNILGQEIITLLDAVEKDAGFSVVIWDGRDQFGRGVPSGVYIYRLRAERIVLTRKMILMK